MEPTHKLVRFSGTISSVSVHTCRGSVPLALSVFLEGVGDGDRAVTQILAVHGLYSRVRRLKARKVDEREAFFPLGLIDPFAIQQLDWLQGIEQGRDPETSGREGLYDLACAFAMLESSTLKQQVSLMEVLSGLTNAYQAEIDAFYGLG